MGVGHHVLALLGVAALLALEGCDEEPATCYPNSGHMEAVGEYSCVSNRYCSRQDFATVLPNAMTLEECMQECKDRNCAVIQYDCGTHCWLLDSCGDHVESGCQSSVYYRDLNFVAATSTTTSTTTTTTTELGACFPNTQDTGAYQCTQAKYCSNQLLALKMQSGLTLTECLAECDTRSGCIGVQFDCNVDCLLFDGETCGVETDTVCGSSLYWKKATTTSYVPSFTSGPANTVNVCFPGTLDNGSYRCSEGVYCSDQNSADRTYSPFSSTGVTLADCMAQCDSRSECTGIQFDCNVDCWLFLGTTCGSELTTTCGSSVYYKIAPTTTVTTSMTTTTTLAGNCFPTTENDLRYDCHPAVYCSNEADVLNLFAMSLTDCMRECERYNCGAIQYNCNQDCWLKRTCESYLNTTCGSSVYLPKQLGWPETTTTTTIFGACFPVSDTLYSFSDFTCSEAVYCENQADAVNFGAMTINQCAELCRHIDECQHIQYDCNTECWLLYNGCTSFKQSTCGSSVYAMSDFTRPKGRTHALADGHSFITYSATSCNADDCLVEATCPTSSWPTECASIPPNQQDGVWQNGTRCVAQGSGEGPIVAQAVCSDLFETSVEHSGTEAWKFAEGEITVSCSTGSAVSCNCYSNWNVATLCGGLSSFPPNLTDAGPRCYRNVPADVVSHRRRGAGSVGAAVSASCAQGRFQESYVWSSSSLATSADVDPEYCGWVFPLTASDISSYGFNQVICLDASPPGAGCTDCTLLADCVQKCNRCAGCQAVQWMPLNPSGCIFMADVTAPSPPPFLDYVSSEQLATLGSFTAGVYVNSRHPSCTRVPKIQRVMLFEDKACSKAVRPQSLVDNLGNSIPSWFTDNTSFTPSCSPTCSHDQSLFKATFSQPTPVMCAVVHSSPDFAQGWSILVDPDLVVAFGSRSEDATRAQVVAASSYGSAVAFGSSPDVAERTEVLISGATLRIVCQRVTSDCLPSNRWQPALNHVLASLLGIPQHMVDVKAYSRRLEEDRRLNSWDMGYSFTIKIVAERPVAAALGHSVLAQLNEMTNSLTTLDKMLPWLLQLPSDVTLSFGLLEGFTRSDTPPETLVLPEPTTTTTSTSTTVQAAAPAVEEDDGTIVLAIILGSFAGVLVLTLFICICRHLYCKRKPAAPVHPTSTPTPAPAPAGGRTVTSSGPSAVVISGKALQKTHSKELFQPLTIDAYNSLPKYWTIPKQAAEVDYHAATRDELAFDELMYVKHKDMRYFQDLVTHTYRSIVTQDRLCPTSTHGKTRGGCPCVQPGGTPGLPTDFQVKRVIRVEDSEMFSRYIMKRDKIRMNRVDKTRKPCEAPDPPFFTSEWLEWHKENDVLCPMDNEINEVYLWHGTQVRVGLQIAQEDFKLTFAGSGAGTMYGKGLYFTESATKADEYAKDEPGGHYDNIRALLLCRVCVGSFYYTQDREPEAIKKCEAGESDSTLGDRMKAVNTYREIVVYDADQVYPEYLVIYERVHGGKAQTPREDLPFLLELPLYWKNVGRNPYEQGFREHWVVKQKIKALIQRLAEGTCRQSVQVQKVRRVEDSALWCRYINWKRNLAKEIQDGDIDIKSPNELDGNPESGHVLTEKILKENYGDEAISLENMQEGLNEMLLWHGTTKKAAETIAEEGFLVAGTASHGRRFGNGVYLAEDLTKSLDYCKQTDGILYVLLCRATCGHIYYTEKDWDSGADGPAKKSGCSCVLANPNQRGPREYILFDVSQVYPEYIVELKRD